MAASIRSSIEVDTEASQPTSLVALLRELGLAHATIGKQKPVLRNWLATHPANRKLRVSLRCNGYGLLLKEDSVAHN